MSDPFDDKEARAADYVLGTLGSAERKEVEASLASDEDLAARVEQWSRRLLPLAQALPPVEPPPSVWRTIERTLDRDLERRPESRLVTDLKAAQGALRRRLALWRWSALVASTVAATLALFIAVTGIWLPVRQDTRFVATLNEGATGPSWFVTVDLETQQLTIRPLGELAGSDRDYELWLVSGAGEAPQSLGLLDPVQEISFRVAPELSAASLPDAVLAISLEPAGGSPTGLPTGPVVYQGALLAVAD